MSWADVAAPSFTNGPTRFDELPELRSTLNPKLRFRV